MEFMRFKSYIFCTTEMNKKSPNEQSHDQINIYINNTSAIMSLLALVQEFSH